MLNMYIFVDMDMDIQLSPSVMWKDFFLSGWYAFEMKPFSHTSAD